MLPIPNPRSLSTVTNGGSGGSWPGRAISMPDDDIGFWTVRITLRTRNSKEIAVRQTNRLSSAATQHGCGGSLKMGQMPERWVLPQPHTAFDRLAGGFHFPQITAPYPEVFYPIARARQHFGLPARRKQRPVGTIQLDIHFITAMRPHGCDPRRCVWTSPNDRRLHRRGSRHAGSAGWSLSRAERPHKFE
jgi:hypothetical protein